VTDTSINAWLDRVHKVEQALRRADIWVSKGEGRLACVICPGTTGQPSRWVAELKSTPGWRYVTHVRCRACGHRLRPNQAMWRIRHELKCKARSETL